MAKKQPLEKSEKILNSLTVFSSALIILLMGLVLSTVITITYISWVFIVIVFIGLGLAISRNQFQTLSYINVGLLLAVMAYMCYTIYIYKFATNKPTCSFSCAPVVIGAVSITVLSCALLLPNILKLKVQYKYKISMIIVTLVSGIGAVILTLS